MCLLSHQRFQKILCTIRQLYLYFYIFMFCLSDFSPWTVQKTSNGIISSELCFERPPSILVPLKVHTPPKGYQLYMTCAVRGCPAPIVSWYLDDVCINSDKNYYITNAFGVCSLYILSVRSKDSGEYKVVAVNPLGKAECASKLVVKGKINQGRSLISIFKKACFCSCLLFMLFLLHRLTDPKATCRKWESRCW